MTKKKDGKHHHGLSTFAQVQLYSAAKMCLGKGISFQNQPAFRGNRTIRGNVEIFKVVIEKQCF